MTTMYTWPSSIGLLNTKMKFQIHFLNIEFIGLILMLRLNMTHDIIKIYFFSHQALHYNQINKFILNHDHKC
jgi:hypothetical protein